MWQSWNAKERVWRTLFFVAAVLILGVVNTWLEATSEQQRRDKMDILIDHIRDTIDEGLETEINNILLAHSLDARDIPYMLQAIKREDESVGIVLSRMVTRIGKLELGVETWESKAEWMSLWDDLAGRAARTSEILTDRSLTLEEQIERIRPMGITAVPYLIEYLASSSGRANGSEVAVSLIRENLENEVLPHTNEANKWRIWANQNMKKYQGLKFGFHE